MKNDILIRKVSKLGRCHALLAGTILAIAVPIETFAASEYETAVSCAGGLKFMVTMLPTGSDPAKEAQDRGTVWRVEAERLGRSGTDADISTAEEKTKTIMMSGDQAAIAEYFATLNDVCAKLPEANPAATNPFDLKYPTAINTYNAAIGCAGRYHIDGANGDQDAKTRFDRFKAFAQETLPDIPPKKLEENIQKATSEWMMAALTMDSKQLSFTAMCRDAYSKIK